MMKWISQPLSDPWAVCGSKRLARCDAPGPHTRIRFNPFGSTWELNLYTPGTSETLLVISLVDDIFDLSSMGRPSNFNLANSTVWWHQDCKMLDIYWELLPLANNMLCICSCHLVNCPHQSGFLPPFRFYWLHPKLFASCIVQLTCPSLGSWTGSGDLLVHQSIFTKFETVLEK